MRITARTRAREIYATTAPSGTKSLRWTGWLLLLALGLGVQAVPAQTRTGSARWEHAIEAFEASDRTNPPPQHAILFIGSSALRLWKGLARAFPDKPVINRGFGGSEITDSIAFAPRIVFPYRPREIVFYAGDNDLAAGKSPEQVLADFKTFVRTVHEKLPETRIAFISIKPSPVRWRLKQKILAANRQIAALQGDHVVFIDIFSKMLGPDGNPRKELFRRDGLHPDAQGYKVWAEAIRPFLN
jgi:lysophospholipase L1-like esterase